MYKVNIDRAVLIDHISLPVLIVYKESDKDKVDNILIGNEISNSKLKEEIVLKADVQKWLDNNIKGKYTLDTKYICFEFEDEAIYFKTVWI